jgi:hypothetical protein
MTTAENAEVQMILADARDVSRVAFALANSVKAGGVLGLAMMPVACFFAVEAYDCLLRRRQQGTQKFLEEHAERVRDIRSRLKLLDSGGFDDAQGRFEKIAQASARMFNDGHRGMLGWLKRWLQDDLGLFFLGSDLICTTHVAILNMGHTDPELERMSDLTLESLGLELRAFSEGIGRFVGQISAQLGDPSARQDTTPVTLVATGEDYKARLVYPRIADRLQAQDLALAVIFTWLVSQVNYVHRGLRVILSPDSSLFFRVRFLTIFHLLQALRAIGARLQGQRSKGLGAVVAELQSRHGARKLRDQLKLRNAMAHYDAEPIAGECGEPIALLVRKLSGMERAAMSLLVDEELGAASSRLGQIVSKGMLGGRRIDLGTKRRAV